MDIDAFVAQVLRGETPPLPALLPDETAAILADRLKAEADRHWRIDAHVSLRCAEMIVTIGQTCENTGIAALGLMARGDALKLLDRMQEAWDTLEDAGNLYLSVGDEVGWARTRIGRLGICVNLNQVETAMSEAEQAREIFLRCGENEKLLRLTLNTAAVFNWLGKYQEALTYYRQAVDVIQTLGEAGESRLGILYMNMGYAEQGLSRLQQALQYYERAYALSSTRQEPSWVAISQLNIASIAQAQGQYRKALRLLHQATHSLATQMPSEATSAQRTLIECYLFLNRYAEARDITQQFVAQYAQDSADYNHARLLLHLATAEAELGNFEWAQDALDRAETIFSTLDAESWIHTIRLRRGHIALKQENFSQARYEAKAAAEFFKSKDQQVDFAAALLLSGRTALVTDDLARAREAGRAVLQTARRCNVPGLRYSAHLLLGQAAERQNRLRQAVRHYQAAASTVERMQRGLTITMRPGFLEDKQDALRSLLRIYLEQGQIERAFETLERAKSQVWLNYLTNREQLRWAQDDPQIRPLIEELKRLREEHHWFYRLANDQTFREVQRTQMQPSQAVAEVTTRERQMRALTEQLYLHSGRDEAAQIDALPLGKIQAQLPEGATLIEFYSDKANTWAFMLNRQEVRAHLLPIPSERIGSLVEQVQTNFARALRAGPQAQASVTLGRIAKQLLRQLYDAFIYPLVEELSGCQRLIVVPYGVLHYLPFHLLYDGARYLIEAFEMVTLPTAGLSTRQLSTQASGAVVLAHTWDGRLLNTMSEGRLVQQRFNGTLYSGEQAQRSVFTSPPRQILHIAAHGQHRIDQPDFSYIQLGDGQLLTDDLLQYDLSYELVTLSACETGRANVAAGDELIGLGRGFLYAGAGALVASLWRVDDALTVEWMEHFYSGLQDGKSKAAALRDADNAILINHPELHPAFWGAFQLIGNADPLSTRTTLTRG